MNKIKILNMEALSYSGTTWLNLLLGSHEEAFTLGPIHRLWENRHSELKNICLVHGSECDFWNGFDQYWNRDMGLFEALQSYSGKHIFIMDNAPQEVLAELAENSNVQVLHGRYLRDARAITASYARKMSAKGVTYIDSIQPDSWFYHSFHAIPELAELESAGILIARYEDAVLDQAKFLQTAGNFLGITYSDQTQRFWEWDHHITSGNQGPIAMIKLHQGEHVGNFESKSVYQAQFERLKKDPATAFNDERWKTQLSAEELQEFSRLLGEKNRALGYGSKDRHEKSRTILGQLIDKLRSK